MNSHTEAATSSTATSIDWDITLAVLSGGIEQLLYQEAGGRKRGTCPDALRVGMSRLAAAMIRAGATPISSIADTIEVMQEPVSTWKVLPPPPQYMGSLILMDGEDITEDAENCIDSNPDVAGEWTQQVMKRVVDNCRARGDQVGYVTFRRCIIDHPVAARRELIETRRKLSDDGLLTMFDDAYEEVPQASLSGDIVRTCARCGWTLVKEVNRDVWRCALSSCRQLGDALPARFPDSIPFNAGTRRVRLGLARYTTRPGGLEISLFRALEELGGLTLELWPHCDAYDIGVTFPNGEKWAIDCKDARDPAWLAGHLNQSQFSTLGSWGQAYYIFPAYRRWTRREYGRVFSSRWRPDPPGVKWGFDDEFLIKVRAQLERMQ